MSDPFLDGCHLVAAVKRAEVSATEAATHFIRRIRETEPVVRAMAHFDEERVMRQAQAIDARRAGAIAGLPVGVKDVLDTADFPTEFNSPIYMGNRPSRDSSVVATLRAQGALVMGKTETSEFAFMHNGPTVNPHGPDRTPGSSSAGSAAGMAAGFFPIALGTQTAGSLIKPASYCGSFAFKPTYGLISMEGIKPLAPSIDTAGWFGRSVDDLELVAAVLLGSRFRNRSTVDRSAARLVIARTDFWDVADRAARTVFSSATEKLKERGHLVVETAVPFDYHRLLEAANTIIDAEASRSLAFEFMTHRDLLSSVILQMFDRANELTVHQERAAREYLQLKSWEMDHFMNEHDAILTLSTAHEAPKGLATTGTSDFIRTWNALGMPQVNLPVGLGPNAMPIGIQLVGQRGGDKALLDLARILANDLGVTHSALAAMSIPCSRTS